MKTILKKLRKTHKILVSFAKKTCKNYVTMKKQLKTAWLLAALIFICSCGSTKVAVSRPAEGTSTTITVTTNNPITTSVPTNLDAQLTKGQDTWK